MDELSNFFHIILIKTTFGNLAKARRITNYALNSVFISVANFLCKLLMPAELKGYLS